jgi:act minimal PKS acyl carrier protein
MQLTLSALIAILRDCAGAGENLDAGPILDTQFDDLGYDSLAMLETAGRIQLQYDVRLDDDAVAVADTPRALLALTNQAIAVSGFNASPNTQATQPINNP